MILRLWPLDGEVFELSVDSGITAGEAKKRAAEEYAKRLGKFVPHTLCVIFLDRQHEGSDGSVSANALQNEGATSEINRILGDDELMIDVGSEASVCIKRRDGAADLQALANSRDEAEALEVLFELDDVNAIGSIAFGHFDIGRCSALMIAAGRGYVEVAKLLLESDKFMEANAVDPDSGSALHGAAMYGSLEIVKLLLDSDRFTEANVLTSNGRTALHFAAVHGHLEIAKLLLESDKFTEADEWDHGGKSALQIAAVLDNLEIAKLLSESDKLSQIIAETNTPDCEGEAEFHYAVERARRRARLGR